MGELWLAYLLKCVSPKWVRRLFWSGVTLRVLFIVAWVLFLYWWSTIRF